MDRLGLPPALLVLAAVITIVGVRRLLRSAHGQQGVRGALIVWFVLIASGAAMWLWEVLHSL